MNKRLLSRGLIIIVLLVLLYFALRHAPLIQIWNTLHQLQLWQIVLILAIDLIIYLFVTARWWLIVQAENKNISYLPMIGVRVSVFGISYFTHWSASGRRATANHLSPAKIWSDLHARRVHRCDG